MIERLYGCFAYPFLGVPIIRIIEFGDLYWGPPILVNYHVGIILLYSLRRTTKFGVQVLGLSNTTQLH